MYNKKRHCVYAVCKPHTHNAVIFPSASELPCNYQASPSTMTDPYAMSSKRFDNIRQKSVRGRCIR